jgi:hypothetical protein
MKRQRKVETGTTVIIVEENAHVLIGHELGLRSVLRDFLI